MNPDDNTTTTNDMPDVINNSWYDPSSEYCNPIYEELFTNVEELGIAIVFSAGNSGSGTQTITTPKNINLSLVNTFATGNIDGANYLTGDLTPIRSSSSRGPSRCGGEGSLLIKPEVCAPGTNIRSSVPGGGYGNKTGTSMAAPHVAGAIVLLKQAFPNFTGEKLKLALYNTAIDLGDTGEDNTYGNGLIDVYAAYQYLSLLCENEITITHNISNDATISANERIVASSKISTGVNAVFAAGTEILLQSGFHAVNGSSFSAVIQPCNNIQNLNSAKRTSKIQSNYEILESNNIENVNFLSIYPNPASSKVTIIIEQGLNKEPCSIMIVDSYGRMMYYIDNNITNSVEVQLEDWPSGVYFGRIQKRDNNRTFKIIKK